MPRGRHAAPVFHRTWVQRIGIASLAVLTGLVAIGAFGLGYVAWRDSQIHRTSVSVSKLADGKPANYLIVGSDSRASAPVGDPNAAAFGRADGSRTDTIMVARIDPHTKKVSLLSLPRDLWVPIAGKNMKERINTAFSFSRQTLIDTVQQNFHIPINHYVEVNFASFEGAVNAIDGVYLYFDTPLRDQHSGLFINDTGCTKLNGSQALAFARSRYLEYKTSRGTWASDGSGDLGRISRQQFFIRRALHRAISKAGGDPLVINDLAGVVTKNLTVDSSLGLTDLVGLGKRFSDFDPESMQTYSLPGTRWFTPGGADVLRLDADKAQPILDLFRDPLPPPTEADVAVTVLNGTAVRTQGPDVAGALQRAGFKIMRWGEGSEIGLPMVAHTQVRYGSGGLANATLVARHLSSGAQLVLDETLDPTNVVVVTGQDFTTVAATPRPTAELAAATSTTVAGGSSSSSGASTSSGSGSTTAAPTTTVPAANQTIGRVPGQPPAGVSCG